MGIIKAIYLLVRAFLLPRLILAAENLALRQQVAVYQYIVKRPKLRTRDRIFWVRLVACAAAVLSAAAWCSARDVDPRAWAELDIIPMPKEIRLTDQDLTLDPTEVVLVVGEKKCRQSEIGAEWINRRINDLGGAPLPILSGQPLPPGKTALILGTAEDNPLIAMALRENIVNIGEKNPGERGYEIRRSRDGSRVYLAGADPLGSLYACVTFGELLQRRGDRVMWRAAEVRDWPDVIYVHMGDYAVGDNAMPELAAVGVPWSTAAEVTAEERKAYLNAVRENYDRLMRWKVTLMGCSTMLKGQRYHPTKAMALVREGVEYGIDRGVGALVYAENPFVGRKEHHPEPWKQMPSPLKTICSDWVRSWGMDDARRETAEHLARHLASLGITHVGFHDTDVGGYLDPCQWNERSEEDRKRWGDDFAAATAHKIQIYCDALRQQNPNIHIIFTQYPYNVEILDPQYAQRRWVRQTYGANTDEIISELREKTVRFWRGLHEKLPVEVALSNREAPADVVRCFRELVSGRPVFTWNAVQGSVTQNRLFGEGPRWVGTFCRNPQDIVQARAADIFVPLNSLAVREYSWNVETPGAGLFGETSSPENEIFTLILPRICRNLFGREASPDIVRALTPRSAPDQPAWNISVIPWYIFTREDTTTPIDSRVTSWVNTSAQMAWQARLAEDGAKSLDNLWEKHRRTGTKLGMSDYAFRRFVNLREVFHACKWMAQIRTQEFLVQEAKKNDPDAARVAIEQGLSLTTQARRHLQDLVRERPDDPVIQRDDHGSYSGRLWRAFMADKVVLDAVERRLPTSSSDSVVLSERKLAALTKNRVIQVVPRNGVIAIDGRLEDPPWRNAHPAETLFVEGQATQVAQAHTRLLALRDREALYVAIQCWAPGEAAVSTADRVEIWLQGGDAKGKVVMLGWTPDGMASSRSFASSVTSDGKETAQWTCEGLTAAVRKEVSRWDIEARIPLESLPFAQPTDASLRADVRRRCPMHGTVETSRLVARPQKDVVDVDGFVPVRRVADGFTPKIRMQFARSALGVQILADGMVTRLSLAGLQIETNLVLHNAVLQVEGLDREGRELTLVLQPEGAKGKLTGPRQTLCRLQQVHYDHREPRDKEHVVLIDSVIMQAAVRLLLRADEGEFTETISVGSH